MADQQPPPEQQPAPEQVRKDRLLAHSYDGIQEYDNPLPAWWTWTFAATVVFTAWYILYFHIGIGPSVYDQYDEAVAAHLEKLLEGIDPDTIDDATLLELVNDGEKAGAMGGNFKTNCANCHRDDAGGNVGPNLTDGYWINATSPTEVMAVIRDGRSSEGMPAWGDRLRPAQVLLLTAYVGTLRGTRPTDPKEPEGDPVDVWVASVAPEAEATPTHDAPVELGDAPVELGEDGHSEPEQEATATDG
jgi:cytochrome c oxidase cbb3-type subunit III